MSAITSAELSEAHVHERVIGGRGRVGALGWGLFCATVALAAWPMRSQLAIMYGSWFVSPEFSHGVIVPFVSAYLVWRRKDELATHTFSGSPWGPVLTLAGFALAAVGVVGTSNSIVQYAFLLAVGGIVLGWVGIRVLRLIAMPLLILVFMVPLPDFITVMLSSELQLLSSRFGVECMRLAGISVYLEGNVIDLGGYRLQVVEACAGLRYLFPLMVLGFIMAYMYRAPFWKRFVLFASSVPLTVVMNGLRIGMIGVMVDRWGPAMAEGLLHDLQGWMVFMLTAGIMLLEVVLLNRFGHDRRGWREVFGLDWPTPAPEAATSARSIPPTLWLTATVALVCASSWTFLPTRGDVPPARRTFAELPSQLGEFAVHGGSMEAQYVESLGLDDYVLANVVRPGDAPVNLYVSYYESQRSGKAVHSPRVCIPGSGWQLRDLAAVEVDVPGVGRRRVNRAIIERGNERQLVYYWFKQRDRILTNEWLVKWYLLVDALIRSRTDGAMIRLIAPMPAGTDPASADRRLVEVMARVVPVMAAYVPD